MSSCHLLLKLKCVAPESLRNSLVILETLFYQILICSLYLIKLKTLSKLLHLKTNSFSNFMEVHVKSFFLNQYTLVYVVYYYHITMEGIYIETDRVAMDTSSSIISHFLYMKDTKLFAKNE